MKEKIEKIINILEKEYEKWDVPIKKLKKLPNKNKFHILIGAILSTRTKDEITLRVLKEIIKRIKNPSDFMNMKIKEIEKMIYPVGFYKVKARNIKKISEIIVKKYDGNVPDNFNELIKLPGVGRKVANIVLSEGFNKNVIAVDTHVARISRRIGIVKEEKIQEKLERVIPENLKKKINFLFVALGQKICLPKNPKCNFCPIKNYCEKSI
ncbi:MAG: endonuclease III [candidate division WOR-3 bacterium]